jgi:hypothetical protein
MSGGTKLTTKSTKSTKSKTKSVIKPVSKTVSKPSKPNRVADKSDDDISDVEEDDDDLKVHVRSRAKESKESKDGKDGKKSRDYIYDDHTHHNLSILHYNLRSKAVPVFKCKDDWKSSDDDEAYYLELNGIPHWRRMLSNDWVHTDDEPIEHAGLKFATLSHAINWLMFKEENPKFAATFSLSSGSIYSRGDQLKLAAALAGKSGRVSKNLSLTVPSRPKEIKHDAYIREADNGEVLEKAYFNVLLSKFALPQFKTLLLATRQAILVTKGDIFTPLMDVREHYRQEVENS